MTELNVMAGKPKAVADLEKLSLSRRDLVWAWLGVAILIATILELLFKPLSLKGFQRFAQDTLYQSFSFQQDLLLMGIFAATFCLAPVLIGVIEAQRRTWRNGYTYAVLAGICVFLGWFLIYFGRWQFGAWDFNIMIDTGWRQLLGQRPYVDFLTPNPPGFNLGIKWAFELFGVNWNANLYFNAIFGGLTFLWMYWLMVKLSLGRLAAMAAAFGIECSGMIPLCFWWYNSSVLMLAAVFFLSCLAYASMPRSIGVQMSYIVSLASLSLMKPNIAGVMIIGGVILLFGATDRKMHLVMLTLAAAVAAMLVLAVNHVSVGAMLASYGAVAKDRGGIGARFGYNQTPRRDRYRALLWITMLAIPLLGLVPVAWRRVVSKDWKGVAVSLLFPLALLVAWYGLMTNGEQRDVECTVLLAAGAVLSFGGVRNGPLLRRLYIAILCAAIAGNLYYGAERVRVCGIGEHAYFEWHDNENRIDSGFLKNMRVSSRMIEVQREVKAAIQANPGTVFLGPRLEYDYAVFGLMSPKHLPVYWQPGTSFGRTDQLRLVQVWKDEAFKTLIFQRFPESANEPRSDSLNYTFYPDELFDAINEGYVEDGQPGLITVYHRRQPQAASASVAASGARTH